MLKSIIFPVLSVLLIGTKLFSANYTFPNDLPSLGCSLWTGTTYQCISNLNFSNNDNINVVSSLSISSGASFTAKNGLTITTNGNNFNLTLGGIFDIGNNLNATSCVNVISGGGVSIGNNGYIQGELNRSSSVSLGRGTLNEACGVGILPKVDYRFDECVWDGTTNEVKDSSLNTNHATSFDLETTKDEKRLVRSGDFTKNSNTDYIELQPSILNNEGDFTILTWIKSNGNEDQTIISGANSSQQNELIMFFRNGGTTFHPYIKGGNQTINISDVTNNAWHHVVWRRDAATGENCITVDRNTTSCAIGATGNLNIEGLIIGQEQDSVGGGFVTNQDFEGYMDEFKIYNTRLSENEIQSIYDNEASSKNYDGTNRDDVFCNDDSCGSYDVQLNISTYDLSTYNGGQIDSNLEFEQAIATYATSANLYGTGLIAGINTQGNNNNPFGADEKYLTIINGYVNVPENGDYTFVVNGDDAVEVLIDDVVVSHWYGGHSRSNNPTVDNRITKNTINLISGYHKIEFRHHENTGQDSYELYWKKPSSSNYEIVPASNFYHCIPYPPLFEYRFDECDEYTGLIDEVKDSSGNDFHGTISGSVFLSQNGQIYKSRRIGLEDNPLDKNAIIANKSPTDIGSVGSISFWYKSKKNWDSSDGVMLIDATKGDKYFFLGLRSNGQLQLWAEDSNDRDFQSRTTDSFSFLMNEWVHIALAWDYTSRRFKLYVNGILQSLTRTVPFTGIMPDLNNIYIGDISENYTQNTSIYDGVKNSANGEFDEFKAYSGELKQVDVTNVYQNELVGNNFDGSFRSEPSCLSIDVCYADDFNRANLGNKWSIIKKQNYTPQISSNKLMLTNNAGSVATGVTLVGKFPSNNNYIEIEFEHNAYGGSGADGVTIALADADIVNPLIDSNLTNIAGAYGGSLGYANRTGTDGFKGGWLGFGFDEYGNFSNPTEGRHGGPGFRRDTIAVRGQGNGQIGYEYIAGTNTLNPQVDNTPVDGYLYKISIDTRSAKTMIKVQRDVKDSNGFITLIDWFDATQTAVSPQNFKFSLTGSTGGSTNIHSINNLIIRAKGCGDLGNEIIKLSSFFDAWDIFKDINNRTISTKKASQNFDLSVVSLNESNNALQDYNGSVCVRLIDDFDKSLTDWNKLQFTNNILNTTFNVNKANKNTKVQIVWKDEVTENCPLSNETNSTKSTDNFAIRPEKFHFNLPSISYAGENFNIDFTTNTLDYNETKDISFQIDANITKVGCDNGSFYVAPFSFENGIKSVDANYSDVGDINITIKEILGSEFAVVDKNDTADIDRLITPYTSNMLIKPYELNVTDVKYDEGWLYMAKVSDINQSVKFSVLANNKQHGLVKNFTEDCYATDVNVKTHFYTENTNNGVDINYSDITEASIDDINRTITIPKAWFINSKADIEYSFNIVRDYKIPYEPIKIGLREVSVESSDVAKIENNATVSLDRDFYYGRVNTEDISTNKQSTPHSLHVEVYKLGKYKQNSLNWYVNEADTNTTMTFTPKVDFTYGANKNGVNVINVANMSAGVINFDITNSNWTSSDSAMIHLDIPTWLWYSKYNTYNSTIDCGSHPCFEYRYIDADSSTGIQSGNFSGSSIGDDYNATKEKIGVKTFR